MRLPYLAAAVFYDILILSAPSAVAAADSDSSVGSATWFPPSNNWYVARSEARPTRRFCLRCSQVWNRWKLV